MNDSKVSVPRVVIVGGGFGGLYAARTLGNAPVEVTLIDKTNHHVFQPLLYQVATASLSPAQITAPLRSVVRNARNTEVMMSEVTGVDTAKQLVLTDTKPVPYDYLILAMGSRHSYFWASRMGKVRARFEGCHGRHKRSAQHPDGV